MLKATKKRDDFIEFWIKDNNYTERKLVAEYHVISDCHNPSYGSGKILELSDLKELRRCYETLPRGSLSLKNDLLCADPELTFLLVGRGSIPENKRASGMSLFIWVEEGGRQRQDFGWELEDRDYLFTRDSFEYLVHTRGFNFSTIKACYFYKKCKVLPQVFGGLVEERELHSLAGKKSLANLTKAFVNYTTGMFGLKGEGAFNKIRLASKLSCYAVNCLESVNFKMAGLVAGKPFYICKRLAPVKKPAKRTKKEPPPKSDAIYKRRKATDAALPIYASVVEFGKLRLHKCLNFLHRTMRFNKGLRVLYSQVDNLVLGLSSDNLEELVEGSKRQEFEQEKAEYFGNAPGKLVEKWKVTTERGDKEFFFASARPCTYGLAVREQATGNYLDGQNKMSGISSITAREAYESNRRLIDGLPGLVFQQERRTNSLLNRDKTTKAIRQLPLIARGK